MAGLGWAGLPQARLCATSKKKRSNIAAFFFQGGCRCSRQDSEMENTWKKKYIICHRGREGRNDKVVAERNGLEPRFERVVPQTGGRKRRERKKRKRKRRERKKKKRKEKEREKEKKRNETKESLRGRCRQRPPLFLRAWFWLLALCWPESGRIVNDDSNTNNNNTADCSGMARMCAATQRREREREREKTLPIRMCIIQPEARACRQSWRHGLRTKEKGEWEAQMCVKYIYIFYTQADSPCAQREWSLSVHVCVCRNEIADGSLAVLGSHGRHTLRAGGRAGAGQL